jgi:hypothetical protein
MNPEDTYSFQISVKLYVLSESMESKDNCFQLFWCSCGLLLGDKNRDCEVLKTNFKKIFKLEWNEFLNDKFRILNEEAHHYYSM